MATRFYVPTPGGTGDLGVPISPAFSAGWEASNSTRLRASTSKSGGTGGTNTLDGLGNGTNPNDYGLVQWIAGPFAAEQTISGTFKAMAACREFSATTDVRAQFSLKAVDLSGQTLLTQLISNSTGALASEWPNGTAQAFRFPHAWTGSGASVSGGPYLEPFYIVAEWGGRIHSTDTTNAIRIIMRDDGASGDMGETEGVVSSNHDPWMEFSMDLKLYLPRFRGALMHDVGGG